MSALHRGDMDGAKNALGELGIEIHNIRDAAKKMEAQQRLVNMREKVRREEGKHHRNNVLDRDEEATTVYVNKDD